MLESEVERYLVRRAAEEGGEVRKVKWPGRNKAPDRVVMLWRWPRCRWAELKKPGGLAAFPKNAHEEAQHREHERMRKQGEVVVVIDSKAGVDALFSLD